MTARDDTAAQHTVGGVYSSERTAFHARLVAGCLAGLPRQQSPVALLLAGGPASGKSTLLAHLGEPPDAAHINPDVFREQLPEYQQMLRDHDPDAGLLTHREASHIAKAALAIAMERRLSVAIDGVGANDEGQFSDKVERLLRAGYAVVVRYATLTIAEAERRENLRFVATGRAVPADVLRQKHRAASRGFDAVKVLPVRVEVYDMTDRDPRLIAECAPDGGGDVQVHDSALYDAFLRKGQMR